MSSADFLASSVYPADALALSDAKVPPLENGDRLTRAEFERRYHAMPNVKKAELIEGVVHMPSPVRLKQHGEPHMHLSGWMVYYVSKTPGLRCGDNSTSRLDDHNEPQPDLMLLLPESLGGTSKLDSDGYVSGAPDLVVEVAASTVSIDLHDKLEAYRRNGVREYLVYRTDDREVDWFRLEEGSYVAKARDQQGRVQSDLFPGLWLDPAALLAGDVAKMLKAVDEGVNTAEHREFVERLSSIAD